MTGTEDLFEKTKVPNQEDEIDGKKALEELVGEGKKYKDLEALAKSRLLADKHIKDLEREQAEYREELQRRMSVEDLYAKIEETRELANRREEPSAENSSENSSNNQTPKDLTEKLEKLLESKLSQREKEGVARRNIETAAERMRLAWGEDAKVELNKKAQEIGIAVEQLRDYAMSDPKVFYRLVGLDKADEGTQKKIVFPQSKSGDVDIQKMPNSYQGEVRNEKFYQKLFKEDKKKYFSKDTQIRMHRDALELGEKFFE